LLRISSLFYLNLSSIYLGNETHFFSEVEKSWFQSCCQHWRSPLSDNIWLLLYFSL